MKSTGEIGLVHIQSEAAVAAGIRRIEVITGQAAEAYYKQESAIMAEVRAMFKNPKDGHSHQYPSGNRGPSSLRPPKPQHPP